MEGEKRLREEKTFKDGKNYNKTKKTTHLNKNKWQRMINSCIGKKKRLLQL